MCTAVGRVTVLFTCKCNGGVYQLTWETCSSHPALVPPLKIYVVCEVTGVTYLAQSRQLHTTAAIQCLSITGQFKVHKQFPFTTDNWAVCHYCILSIVSVDSHSMLTWAPLARANPDPSSSTTFHGSLWWTVVQSNSRSDLPAARQSIKRCRTKCNLRSYDIDFYTDFP